MELGLKGKVVVITGGGSGIGKTAALEFAREGCKIAICGRSLNKLESACGELKALGAETYAEAVDVADVSALKRFAENVCNAFGRLDVWVNNAGVGVVRPIWEITEENWDYVVNINQKGLFFASQYAAEHMKMQGGGVIINISSYTSVIPTDTNAIYSATKSAVNSLTRTLAAGYAPFGIRVVGIIPGMIETEMTAESVAQNRDKLTAPVSAGRLGRPEDLTKPMVMLASDVCGYITGTVLEISGGKFAVQSPRDAWELAGK